ncbi:MAG: NAD(P)H-dependent glycerol-3-phosphate dehydrogenase, partial [Chloroflexota bacterium]
MPKIAVVGTTSWGITLGVIQARGENSVSLWARTEDEAEALKAGARPRAPGLALPSELTITASLAEAIKGAKAVLLVVPSQTVRQNIKQVSPYLKKDMLVISCAKGLEIGSNKRMSQVIAEEINPKLHSRICVLSGPNLAGEIARNLPAATVIAADDEKVAREAQKLLSVPNFCVYTNTDVVGVELGGALKNIIALGAGIIDGFNCGDNAKAALITRGLTEITALGVALGANPFTFSGLAGMGDLIATCASTLSRNHYVGTELAKGRPINEIVESMSSVAEGVTTTSAALSLAKKLRLEMPITERIYKVLYNGAKPEEMVGELIGLEGRHELAGK